MLQPVELHAGRERLRQPVVHAVGRGDLILLDRVEQPHRVPGKHRRRRRRRQPVARRRARQRRVQRAEVHAEEIFPQRRREGLAPRPAERIEQRPLDERRPKLREQRRNFVRRAPFALPRVKFLPERERCRRPDRPRPRHRGADHHEHLVDLLRERPIGILGEPLRRQVVRRQPLVRAAVDLERQPQDHVRHLRHRHDAVPERHPRPQRDPKKIGLSELDHFFSSAGGVEVSAKSNGMRMRVTTA